eukprot:Tbor_TRINITY_DN5875_c3_g1::TRINITY_DN5875_c3_g1_i1::g.6711::m.6711
MRRIGTPLSTKLPILTPFFKSNNTNNTNINNYINNITNNNITNTTNTILIIPLRTKYSPQVLDHYTNPRNIGTLPNDNNNNTVSAIMGAPECGDMLKLSLRIDPDTLIIEEAVFKAFGCGSAIAASSYATEAIRGGTIAQALALTNKDIARELSLPPVKLHCSMLAEETIRAAIDKYMNGRPEIKTRVTRERRDINNNNNNNNNNSSSSSSGAAVMS